METEGKNNFFDKKIYLDRRSQVFEKSKFMIEQIDNSGIPEERKIYEKKEILDALLMNEKERREYLLNHIPDYGRN